MSILIIVLLVLVAIIYAQIWIVVIQELVIDLKNGRPVDWGYLLLGILFHPFGVILDLSDSTKISSVMFGKMVDLGNDIED